MPKNLSNPTNQSGRKINTQKVEKEEEIKDEEEIEEEEEVNR